MVTYEPTWESLDRHEVPQWYEDAKLGIFIHWGAYSVPSWAPVTDTGDVSESGYAEWYPRGMYSEGSDVREYHLEHYGEAFEYGDFLPYWHAEAWDPDRWAEFFAEEVGAGYVVMTAEHHDGIQLWDSDVTDWTTIDHGPGRDIIGELGAAVRDRGLKFAGSFHGLLNFYDPENPGLFDHPDLDEEGHPGPEYVSDMNERLYDLIDETKPDLLWLDGNWKASAEEYKTKETIAYYYEQASAAWDKEVAVNDRIGSGTEQTQGDFYTPEYDSFDEISEQKWEATRGLGGSFGYNRNEPDYHYISVTDLVHSFVDIVSKNGNLLINVGPRADGTIPRIQRERLSGLGEWLALNREAIVGSIPWVESSSEARDGTSIRYTWNDGALYVTTLEWPDSGTLAIETLSKSPDSVELLTESGPIDPGWTDAACGVVISIGDSPPVDHPGHAYTFRFRGIEHPTDDEQ